MRILVIGASGFVGRHLANVLRERFQTAPIKGVGRSDGVDLLAPATVQAALDRERPTHVVLLAAEASVSACEGEPERAFRLNTEGPFTVARAIIEYCPSACLLFVSSGEAYGQSAAGGNPVAESAVLAPRGVYGGTKAAAEALLCGLIPKGLHVVIARPFSHIGPGQSTRFAIPAFARQIAEIEAGLAPPILQTGRLDVIRDYLDVRDVCSAYADLLEFAPRLAPGETFNIASGVGRPLEALVRLLLSETKIPVSLQFDPARYRPNDLPVTIGDASKLSALAGWRPRIPITQTVRDILDWERRQVTLKNLQPPSI